MSLTPRPAVVTGRLPTTLLLLQRNGCPRSRASPLPTVQGALHCLLPCARAVAGAATPPQPFGLLHPDTVCSDTLPACLAPVANPSRQPSSAVLTDCSDSV